MDMVLRVVINDGEEIIVDGYDKITFYNTYPIVDRTETGYVWHRDKYDELVNNLISYNFIEIKRYNISDLLEYRGESFAFQNGQYTSDEPLLLKSDSIYK